MRRVGKDWPSEMDVTLGVYCRAESEEKRGDRPFKGEWYDDGQRFVGRQAGT